MGWRTLLFAWTSATGTRYFDYLPVAILTLAARDKLIFRT